MAEGEAKRKRHPVWRVALAALRIGVVAYVLATALLFFLQSRLLYWPTREITATPKSIGLVYEDVTFQASDGVKLNGWCIPASPRGVPAPEPRGTILFCHGNGGNLSGRVISFRIFHDLGFNVFAFDYRGYGRSEGSPSEQGIYLDAEAAWAYVVTERGESPNKVVVVGRSLGGAVAAYLAAQHGPAALILESTFTSVPDRAREIFRVFPVRLIARSEYNTLERIGGIRCPKLIVHSRQDETIPFEHGRRLFEAAAEPKEFLEIRGGHNEGFMLSGGVYVEGLREFLARLDATRYSGFQSRAP